ncbi:MAG: hypothetical protein IT329_11475 [Caldilineaceae bacterium]|nr:hypothetical protein [Caldilineaceae bacterium]
MYTLANDLLHVSILDPVADRDRFGVRYCTGGYIFQVSDHQLGDLMSGPTYPDSFNWFDGQGIPDAFNLQPLRDPDAADSQALVLGIGLCDLAAKEVRSFCDWEVSEDTSGAGGRITFHTVQRHQNFAVELERTVRLEGRTLRSQTRLWNRGPAPVPVRWFPHPFYPQPETDELIKLNVPVAEIKSAGQEGGYEVRANGFIARRGWPWDKGYYQPLDHASWSNLAILQKHPKLGLVAATCSYAPDYFPIWGNPRTFSWEPFLERTVGSDQEMAWWIDYEF